MNLGIKGATVDEHFKNRMTYEKSIDVYEFHLVDTDFTKDGLISLEEKITYLTDRDIKVILHQPMTYKGLWLNMRECDQEDKTVSKFIDYSMKEMVKLCKKYDCRIVAHWHYVTPYVCYGRENAKKFIESYDHLSEVKDIVEKGREFVQKYGQEYIYLENAIDYRSSYDYKGIFLTELLKDDIINLTFDISHAFITLNGDNDLLVDTMKKLNHKIKHFHIVDSLGESHDSLTIGDGLIDWKRIKPIIEEKYRTSIYEVGLKDFSKCTEMIESHERYKNI